MCSAERRRTDLIVLDLPVSSMVKVVFSYHGRLMHSMALVNQFLTTVCKQAILSFFPRMRKAFPIAGFTWEMGNLLVRLPARVWQLPAWAAATGAPVILVRGGYCNLRREGISLPLFFGNKRRSFCIRGSIKSVFRLYYRKYVLIEGL